MAQFSHLGIVTTKQISTAATITNAVTSYSNSFKFNVSAGFAAIEVKTITGATAISQQCSTDNANWYDPTDYAGNPLGVVATAVSAAGYYQYSPVIAPYIRYKYVPTSTGTITTNFIGQE